ncbi:MAG TPA: TspO/MBR family protein [Thermodesulfobacteriota bacterium]|nr:TspO/MBR family protein [Thermodesulfobacteriota bacterium]
MRFSEILKLVASVILCQIVGFLGSLFTTPAIPTWYATLKKPFFTPPNWIFTPVWVSLFILMGISLFFIWQRQGQPQFKKALILFFVQLVLNVLWSVAFFGLRSPLLGLVDIVLLWIAILFTILHFLRISKFSGVLLLPYLMWVSFAALLNFSLWILNR